MNAFCMNLSLIIENSYSTFSSKVIRILFVNGTFSCIFSETHARRRENHTIVWEWLIFLFNLFLNKFVSVFLYILMSIDLVEINKLNIGPKQKPKKIENNLYQNTP